MTIIREERGWAGHFIAAFSCSFRRNTLLTYGDIRIVVSTVGEMHPHDGKKAEVIGYRRYYETMAFASQITDVRYHDADVSEPVEFESQWAIDHSDADDEANAMHEAVVAEIMNRLVVNGVAAGKEQHDISRTAV